MARSIVDIKAAMAVEFMCNEAVAERYGFVVGQSFSEVFSPVSVESVLLYVMATAAWAVECLLDVHMKEVADMVGRLEPHRARWYRDKALRFMNGHRLTADGDDYDLTGLSEDEIAQARVVKHAVATESGRTGMLMVKVAGVDGKGHRQRLGDDVVERLRAYFAEIKDAGVRLTVASFDGDEFGCELNVAYDPQANADVVEAECRATVEDYVENLAFNGEYSNMALVNCVQGVAGVKVVDLVRSEVGGMKIESRYVPRAGYFKAAGVIINMEPYESYE